MKEWIHEGSDMMVGSVALAVFLVFVFALGKAINSFKNARFARAWTPLIPVIQGSVVEDGGGAASSGLAGTYQGRRVFASMMPGRSLYSGETGSYYNSFEVELLDVSGGQDWWIKEDGSIQAKDPALRQRLEAAGVLTLVERFGSPEIGYSRSQARIRFSEDAGPVWIPSPERFEAEIGLLLRLDEVNRAVNPAAS